MGGFRERTMRAVLVGLLAVILVGGVAQAVYIDAFNKTPHTVTGADDTQETYLEFNNREDSTSTWVKRDFDLDGQKVDLLAQTVDGKLHNDSDDVVESWVMTMNVEGDCFINNAWCGTVEIHQATGTDEEVVQTLDLRSYDLNSVEFSHLYDGDLLIPLSKGDYIVYYPSAKDNELEIAPHTELTMGVIFYYLGELDLSNYSIEYYYHRDFTYGIGFVALVVLAVLWLFLFAGLRVADASYKRALKEMELRKSGIASMSSIYSIISFIDLKNDEIIPVYAAENTKGKVPTGPGAREKLLEIFERDTSESYREVVLEFIDIGTLPQRLERESIACEYVSKRYGWSQVRFFVVERQEGGALERVLLTIQDITEEKQELGRFQERAVQAERENRARNSFIAGVSSSMRFPIQEILDYSASILNESDEPHIRSYAKQIDSRIKLLKYMMESTSDDFELTPEEYSLNMMVGDIEDIVMAMMQGKSFELETDVSPSIPDRLIGDALGIERTLIGLFAYTIRRAEGGAVMLSIFGKEFEGAVHLLFSVRVSGNGIAEDELADFASFVKGLEEEGDYSVGNTVQELEMAAVQLALTGSKLQIVNSPGEGYEFYFEIEQGIAPHDRGANEDGDVS